MGNLRGLSPLLVFALATAAQAQAGYQTNFDDASGWTFHDFPAGTGVAWAADGTPSTVPGGAARTGTSSLNYNNGIDYQSPGTDNSGLAVSPVISIAGMGDPKLVFWCNYRTEPGSEPVDPQVSPDERYLTLRDAASGTPISLFLGDNVGAVLQYGLGSCAPMGVWHSHTVNLPAHLTSLQVEFGFATLTDAANTYAGWFIDDLSVHDAAGASGGAAVPTSARDGREGPCGALGLEAFLVLGFAAALRAVRARKQAAAGLLVALALAAPAAAQEDAALDRAREARGRCEGLLLELPRVRISGLAGVDGAYRILVSCDDPGARDAARRRLGGDDVDGVRVSWAVAPKPAMPRKTEEAKREPAPPPRTPEKSPPWDASLEACDILRDHLRLKPVSRVVPCQLVRRSVLGGGGAHSYVYTKHRNACPVRLGRVDPPAWSDSFMAWVFTKGFTPVSRSGFLFPCELRADDKLWDAQAVNELKTRLPYIRESAEWASTPGAYAKVSIQPWFWGTLPTGGWPGQGWTWSDPARPVRSSETSAGERSPETGEGKR